MVQNWGFQPPKYTTWSIQMSRPLRLWSRVLIMKKNEDLRQPSEQRNPCTGYSQYLPLHCLGQFLDLHHVHPMRQTDEFHVYDLQRMLQICTLYVATLSPQTMLRETILSSRAHIFMYMINISLCHHPETCFFIYLCQKIQKYKQFKNKMNSRLLPISLYVDPYGMGISRTPWKSIPAQGYSYMATICLSHQWKNSGGQGVATCPPPSYCITLYQCI